MNLAEALEKARRILREEQSAPTLTYAYVSDDPPGLSQSQYQSFSTIPTVAMAGALVLKNERENRPRNVHEDPKLYKFSSVNFDLLIIIFNQVIQSERSNFILGLLSYVAEPIPSREKTVRWDYYPHFGGHVSALPLIAEFCIRTGHLKELLDATKNPKFPTNSLAMMLMEIEEMIALNFNLFSESELEAITNQLLPLREMGYRFTWSERQSRGGGPIQKNPHYVRGFESPGEAIVGSIDGIIEECRKAQYFYLKGELQQLPNLEIESDKIKVEGFLLKLGFRSDMAARS